MTQGGLLLKRRYRNGGETEWVSSTDPGVFCASLLAPGSQVDSIQVRFEGGLLVTYRARRFFDERHRRALRDAFA